MLSSSIIDYIHKLSRKFIKECYKEEIIFFDSIWEIYEPELRKWIDKPPEKWHFKIHKIRLARTLGFSDSSQVLDLITPKILEIISASIIQVAKLKGYCSLERIEEIISNCSEKLPSSLRLQTINYFAPLILRDLRRVRIIPEKEVKKEYEIYTYLGRDEIMKNEYLQQKEVNKDNYLIWIDEISNKFFIYGDEQTKVDPIQKKALKLIVKNAGYIVRYKEIFESISRIAKRKSYKWEDSYRENVHRWFSDLHKTTNNKLKRYVINIPKDGYMFEIKEKPKFCMIDYLPS